MLKFDKTATCVVVFLQALGMGDVDVDVGMDVDVYVEMEVGMDLKKGCRRWVFVPYTFTQVCHLKLNIMWKS